MQELVFVDDARIFGGGQRNVLRLARFIAESLPERSVRVICPAESELARHCRAARIPVTDAHFPGIEPLAPVRITRAVAHLRRAFADFSSDAVVVGTSLRAQVYAHAASVRLGRPLRIVHFLPEQDSAGRRSAKVLLRRWGAVVVVGDRAARTYQALLPNTRVHVVNNFLLPEEFAAAARRARTARDGGPWVVGTLARLIPEKGVLELVAELAENLDKWSRLLIGGARQDEQYSLAVEKRIAALGLHERVRLLGHVADFAEFFGEVEALVVPSVGNEGQPTVILEALAFGRPVIVREPIWSDAFTGLPVTAYRDGSDLGDALARLEATVVPPEELTRRFGPLHVVEAIESAASES